MTTKKRVEPLGGGLFIEIDEPTEIDKILGFPCGKIKFRRL